MTKSMVDKVYGATSSAQQQSLYDEWSAKYERELCAMGYRSPSAAAAVFAHHVPLDVAPILDAGCGGGLQAEPLTALGYRSIIGIDLSEGMLSVARSKGIYQSLHQMRLGDRLDFEDNYFAAAYSVGTITPGHAPPQTFAELIRVTRPKSPIVFTLRSDSNQDPGYGQTCQSLEVSGQWRHIFSSNEFPAMPYGEPDVLSRVHVYEVV